MLHDLLNLLIWIFIGTTCDAKWIWLVGTILEEYCHRYMQTVESLLRESSTVSNYLWLCLQLADAATDLFEAFRNCNESWQTTTHFMPPIAFSFREFSRSIGTLKASALHLPIMAAAKILAHR